MRSPQGGQPVLHHTHSKLLFSNESTSCAWVTHANIKINTYILVLFKNMSSWNSTHQSTIADGKTVIHSIYFCPNFVRGIPKKNGASTGSTCLRTRQNQEPEKHRLVQLEPLGSSLSFRLGSWTGGFFGMSSYRFLLLTSIRCNDLEICGCKMPPST